MSEQLIHYGSLGSAECGADAPNMGLTMVAAHVTCRTCRGWLPLVAPREPPAPVSPQAPEPPRLDGKPRDEEEPFSEGFLAGRMSDQGTLTADERERAYQAYRAGERWNNSGDRTPLQNRLAVSPQAGALEQWPHVSERTQAIRRCEVMLRDYLFNGAKHLEELHAMLTALLPADNADLPSIADVSGLWRSTPEAASPRVPQGAAPAQEQTHEAQAEAEEKSSVAMPLQGQSTDGEAPAGRAVPPESPADSAPNTSPVGRPSGEAHPPDDAPIDVTQEICDAMNGERWKDATYLLLALAFRSAFDGDMDDGPLFRPANRATTPATDSTDRSDRSSADLEEGRCDDVARDGRDCEPSGLVAHGAAAEDDRPLDGTEAVDTLATGEAPRLDLLRDWLETWVDTTSCPGDCVQEIRELLAADARKLRAEAPPAPPSTEALRLIREVLRLVRGGAEGLRRGAPAAMSDELTIATVSSTTTAGVSDRAVDATYYAPQSCAACAAKDAEIATLTAERDEARRERDQLFAERGFASGIVDASQQIAVDAAAELTRLRARLTAVEWQSIETAPKDGRVVLWRPSDERVSIGDYDYGAEAPFWREDNDDSGIYSKAHPPTHWMPLPATPDQLTAAQGQE